MKVNFKNPLDVIDGIMGGDTVYNRNGSYVCKDYHVSNPPVSYYYRQILSVFNSISEICNLMDPVFIWKWEEYYPYVGKSKNYRDAFLANNIQLNYPFFKEIDPFYDITVPAENPYMPNCFDAYYDEESDQIKFAWLDDYESEMYIVGGYFKHSNRKYEGTPLPKLIFGDLASTELYGLSNTEFTYSTSLWVTIRSLNIRGEVSPWCPAIEVELPDPPDVDFSADPRSGESPLHVDFTNLSTGKIKNLLWNFGDGYSSVENNPSHVYDGGETYFSPKLTAWGCANSKLTKTRHNYIHLTNDETWDTVVFVCDSDHNRIFKRNVDGFGYIAKIGSLGSGNDEFNKPFSCCADHTHVFIVDQGNSRIVKRLKSDLSYVDQVGSDGTGDDQFSFPYGITCDDTHLFICDLNNARIHKRLKSDLSLVSMLNEITEGAGRFKQPWGISCDWSNIYFTDQYYDAVLVFSKSTLSFVSRLGPDLGDGVILNNPKNILVDSGFIWIVYFPLDSEYFAVTKLLKVSHAVSGAVFTSIQPYLETFIGLACNSSFIWITNPGLNRIYRYNRITFALVATYGESNEGNDGYNTPRGLAIASPFTIP